MTNPPAGYSARDGAPQRQATVGRVSRPIAGLGKLDIGTHALTVLSAVHARTHWVVLLQDPAGHCHVEMVEFWPPELCASGTAVQARIGPTAGYAVARDVDRFQARDALTGAPIDGLWYGSLDGLYQHMLQSWPGVFPASTRLNEVSVVNAAPFFPTIYIPESAGSHPGTARDTLPGAPAGESPTPTR